MTTYSVYVYLNPNRAWTYKIDMYDEFGKRGIVAKGRGYATMTDALKRGERRKKELTRVPAAPKKWVNSSEKNLERFERKNWGVK